MASDAKRKADDIAEGGSKRPKTKKQWRVPRSGGSGPSTPTAIEPGDSGIWVTCTKGKEAKCVGELRDLFGEYAEQLYPDSRSGSTKDDVDVDDAAGDIENEINAELSDIRKGKGVRGSLFTSIRINAPCVVFFKTMAPIEPVAFVKKICDDALANTASKRTRFAQRLSPMTLIGRASPEGLVDVARAVLQPHFHQEPFQKKKFAIRPTLRHHSVLTRNSIINEVAKIVGPGHEVDLKNYDLLIVVEAYQNVCGVSVLDADFERLKRYNIAEIYDPTPIEKSVEATKA